VNRATPDTIRWVEQGMVTAVEADEGLKHGSIMPVPTTIFLGYGLTGGAGVIWICMPYIERTAESRRNAVTWWGDAKETPFLVSSSELAIRRKKRRTDFCISLYRLFEFKKAPKLRPAGRDSR
jgi:hypothetical protein